MTRTEFYDYMEMSVSKKYRVNNDFTKDPIAICDHISLGFDSCDRREGKYCYCKLGVHQKQN